jgi:uncharacterized protein
MLNLKTAVQDDKVMQDFDLESLSMGADHFQTMKATPSGRDYSSKDCVTLSSSTAAFRFKVLLDDGRGVRQISHEQFEKLFGIKYLAHLRFDSDQSFKKVICNCPLILKYMSWGEENRALGFLYRPQIALGTVADTVICWIDPKIGYGLFAGQDLEEGAFVGEYTGLVRHLDRLHPDYNAYCFHYPTRFFSWNYYVIDASQEGNETRFINHSDVPNLRPICLVDRNLLHLVFLASQPISKGSELTFNYGTDFWQHRTKWQ